MSCHGFTRTALAVDIWYFAGRLMSPQCLQMPGSGSGDVVITPELPTSPPEYTIRETSTVNITLADSK